MRYPLNTSQPLRSSAGVTQFPPKIEMQIPQPLRLSHYKSLSLLRKVHIRTHTQARDETMAEQKHLRTAGLTFSSLVHLPIPSSDFPEARC